MWGHRAEQEDDVTCPTGHSTCRSYDPNPDLLPSSHAIALRGVGGDGHVVQVWAGAGGWGGGCPLRKQANLFQKKGKG